MRQQTGFAQIFLVLLMVAGLIIAVYLVQQKTNLLPKAKEASNLYNPTYHPTPVIKWGNSSYHDSLGARDPFVAKDNGTYYLYYDCSEQLYNPSFESNLGTNGWETWHASIYSTTEQKLYGDRSLKVVTDGISGAGAFTGNYYYNGYNDPQNPASPTGLDVMPNTSYIASAYFYAAPGVPMRLLVQQFRDDPYYFNNKIRGRDTQQIVTGNGSWQRVSVPFTADTAATAITLSFATLDNDTAPRTSYWDGVQLERVDNGVTTPSNFPTDIDFNRNLEDVIGWKSCVATSRDGVNFTKKGPLVVTGTQKPGEQYEKQGSVGTSFMYANVFKNNSDGYWYAYTWEAGYELSRAQSYNFTPDPGVPNVRRQYYNDRRDQLANGIYTRSGLLKGSNPLGPFHRYLYPVVEVDGYPGSCNTSPRTCSSSWGCEYLAASGVPQQINGQWVEFLAGASYYQQNSWGGTGGATPDHCNAINVGFATSTSPIGPWVVKTQGNKDVLFSPSDINTTGVLEGPIYYYDQGSGYHFLFVNQISGGTSSVKAFWTTNPLSTWPVGNTSTVINYNQIPWTGGQTGQINLPTVVENGNHLMLYYGVRSTQGSGDYGRSYLFHDIGLATFSLPLLSGSSSKPTASVLGPANGSIGQNLAFSASVNPGSGSVTRNDIWVTTVSSNDQTPWPYSCPGTVTGAWCLISSGSTSSLTGSWTPTNPDNYYVVVNGYNSNGQKCTGNPFQTLSGWYNCGSSAAMRVTVSPSPSVVPMTSPPAIPAPPQPTATPNPIVVPPTPRSTNPTATISGPTSGSVNQSLQFNAVIKSGNGSVTQGEIWVTTVSSNDKTPWPYSCAGESTGPWCLISRQNLSGNSVVNLSGSWTPTNPDNYYVVVNGYNSNGQKCTGNPFQTLSGWYNCGSSAAMRVTIH